MFYKIIENFRPSDPRWSEFALEHWIQPLDNFDSIDGVLCPDLFKPVTPEDWSHCVNADSRLNLITDEAFARKVFQNYPGSRLVAVIETKQCDNQPGLLGYDILDAHNGVSLVTNWDPFKKPHPLSGFKVEPNGLIASFEKALQAATFLQTHFPEDVHAQGATVWAVFAVAA